MISRRAFFGMAGAGMAGLLRGGAAGAAISKPNIVLILVDDLGWTDFTCYGSRYYETPNIDRLCAQGVKFTNGYAACAVCSPTRAAVMTGRYPARVGITDWIRARFQGGKDGVDLTAPTEYEGGPERRLLCPPNPFWLELDEITIAEMLKPAGYTTCHIGKWHLGTESWFPDRQGFDHNIGGCDYGQPPSYFDPYCNNRVEGIPTLPPRKEGEYLTDREADEAARFIREHAGEPFFLYLAHYAVHTPIQGKPGLVEKYTRKPVTNQKDPAYAAMVESVDRAVGAVVEALDDAGLTGNTIVIVTGDNGGLLGPTDNAPLRSGKGFPYEGGIRVPLIVRWPGVTQPDTVCHEPVTSVDFFPTLCAAAGVALPQDRPIDGVGLRPLLEGSGSIGREAIYWHFPHYRLDSVVPYSIIRAGDWKLIKQYEGKPFELFNLAEDTSEQRDLSQAMPEKVAELDAALTRWLRDTGAKLPIPNPAYAGAPDSERGTGRQQTQQGSV